MADNWEFYEDKAGEWRWRLKATNGNIIGAASEGYKAKNSCIANAERHGYNDKAAEYKNDNWEFYTDKAGEHRWRRKSSNGEIVGAATEGYKAKADCLANAKRLGYAGN